MLRQATQTAGGNASWSTASSTMNVNIYGVNVSFRLGNDGVREIAGMGLTVADRVAVRADVFYPAVVNVAREIVFVGAHEVVLGVPTGRYHTCVMIFVSPQSPWHNNLRGFLPEHTRWGIRYAAIGGRSWEDNAFLQNFLEVVYSNQYDVNLDTKVVMRHLYTETQSNLNLVRDFYDVAAHYFDNSNRIVPYMMIPRSGRYEFNSNSFVSGFLQCFGYATGNINLGVEVTGWLRPVPRNYFGR